MPTCQLSHFATVIQSGDAGFCSAAEHLDTLITERAKHVYPAVDGHEGYNVLVRLWEGEICALLKDSADLTVLKVARDHSDMRYVAMDNPEVKLQLLSMLGEMLRWLDAQASMDASLEASESLQRSVEVLQRSVEDPQELPKSTLRLWVNGSILTIGAITTAASIFRRNN